MSASIILKVLQVPHPQLKDIVKDIDAYVKPGLESKDFPKDKICIQIIKNKANIALDLMLSLRHQVRQG